MVMVDISGDRGSLFGLGAWPTGGGLTGCGLWLALGWGEGEQEGDVGCELTHGTVDSKQRERARESASESNSSSKADPQVQYRIAHTDTHTPTRSQHSSECGYYYSLLLFRPRSTHEQARVRPPSPALLSLVLPVLSSTSHLTLLDYAGPTDHTAGCHLFLPAR